jgi:uncharacterized protein
MDADHFTIWRGLDALQVEAASVDLADDGMTAAGTQIGSDPVAYRLDYRLDARSGFVTRSLEISALGRGWRRELQLRHDGNGSWTCRASADGELALPAPGCDASVLAGALDCDLARSPLTNLMPIRRSGLNQRPGSEDFVMAWVSVPDLTVVTSAQRYEHVKSCEDGSSVVRYVDRDLFDGFTADLELDVNGLVVRYPGLAERVGAGNSPAG